MLTLQNLKNTNILIFLWRAMSVFQHFRINLSLRKDYFNNLFHTPEYSDNNTLNNERHQFIKDVFNSEEIFFGNGNKYVYSRIDEIDNVIIGRISKRKTRNNRFDYKKKTEEIPHYEQTILFVSNSQTDVENWQTIYIMENGSDFKENLDKLLTKLWQKANPNNDIFDINIRPLLANYTEDFFKLLRSPNEYKIQKITEIKIHYDIGNHGFGDDIKKSMQSIGAVEFDNTFKNENGLTLHDDTNIKQHISSIGNGINGYASMRGVKFNQTRVTEVHRTGKHSTSKTTKVTTEFSADEVSSDNLSQIFNQLKTVP